MTNNNNNSCEAAKTYASIQQAYKKEPGEERKPVSFTTPIQAVYDGKTGASLEAILAQFNSVYIQYQGSPEATRLIIPMEMRRAGLTITYMDMESNTITERANSAVQKDNDHWGLDVNWSRVDELSLSGDISVSAKGTWIINGVDTGIKAVGPKGDTGLTPWLKTINNKLHFSYDNVTWEPCSENIAAWFRWSGNKIQISRDNKTWTDLSSKFADNVHIKGYVANYASLPTSAVQGDIYGVGPTYAAEDTAHTNPIYRYYVRNANTWVDNGSFTSLSAGVVQETGDSETEVMSQKAVSEKLSELGSNLASGRNLVYYYEQGYINSKNKILRGEGERFKFVMIPVHEGEKYAYYSKYYDDLYIAFCADKDTWYERKRVVVGWQEIIIPSGCNFLAISVQFYESDSDAVDNAFLYNKKISEELSTEVSKLSTEVSKLSTEVLELEKELLYTTKNIAPLSSFACPMEVGTSPSIEARSTYKCFRVSLKMGDRVSVVARSGESLPSYGLVKDNLFIFVSAVGIVVEQTFECDGSFDEIIVNNYLGYVSDPIVIKYERKSKNQSEAESADKEVNVLMLGNSFTQDSMSYVPFIMQNIAPSIKLNIAIGYIGGCSLAQHCANLLGESQVLNDKTYLPISYTYQLYESGENAWKTIGSKTIDEILAEKKWNIITLQQNGGNAASSWDKYYAPYIYKIHKALYKKVKYSVKLGWLLVHGAYATSSELLLSNWKGSADNSLKIQNLTPNQVVFPYGTAVQNLRTAQPTNLGDGGNLMADDAHLHEGIGCLTAAYANTLTILDALGLGEISIVGESTRPTKAWCTEHGVLEPNYGSSTNDVIGITEDNCYLAQVAAIQAVKKPYEVTDCSIFVK